MPAAHRHKFRVSIEGAKQLDKQLEVMGDQAADLIDAAVRAGGEIALGKAKQNMETRLKAPTGNLERNTALQPVTRRSGKAGIKKRVLRGSIRLGFNRTKKGAGDDAYYGSFVELGHKWKNGRKMSGKKMLRDALDKNRKRIAAAIVNTFRRLRG